MTSRFIEIGKISEGIDFADDRCRAVIITGLPFPPYNDPKVKLKREFLDGIRAEMIKNNKSNESGFKIHQDSDTLTSSSAPTLTGADYYTNQAFRAVNQALGRVIRHRADYGAILLLDNRFEQTKYQIGLSKWLRPHIDMNHSIGASIASLKRFFNDAVPEPIPPPPLKDDSNNGTNVEDGDALDELKDVSKIVMVKTNSIHENGSTSASMHHALSLTQDESNFIHPNRIIKTMESMVHKNDTDSFIIELPKLERKFKAPSEGLQSLYKRNSILIPKEKPTASLSSTIASAWSAVDKNRALKSAEPLKMSISSTPLLHSSTDAKPSTKAFSNDDRKGADRALEFFTAAKGILRSNEFELLGSKLKMLHLQGKAGDSDRYLKISSEIIDILLMIEHDQSMKLLELFYLLLPSKYNSTVMTIACMKRFDASELKVLCEQYLPTADFDHIQKNITKAMITYSDDVIALGHIKSIIDIWNGNTSIQVEQKNTLLASMLRILPVKMNDPVTALWNNMNISKNDSLQKWLVKCKETPKDLSDTNQRVPKGINCIVCKNPICHVSHNASVVFVYLHAFIAHL